MSLLDTGRSVADNEIISKPRRTAAFKEDTDMLTKVLCNIALLIIPCCTFLIGLKRKSGCAMRARLGYSSDLALTNEQAWAYAQHASSIRYMVVSVVLAVATLWFFNSLPFTAPAAPLVSALTVFMFQMLVMIFVIASVEIGLRDLLHPKAKKAKK